jgi:NADPH:quinone reductase-like Zn-dependent oxidoreductase
VDFRGITPNSGSTTVTRTRKIFAGILTVVVVAFASLSLILSHESACPAAASAAPTNSTMQAVMQRCYGSGGVLEVENIEKPIPSADELLIRVHAVAVNPLDWHMTTGKPYIMRLSEGLGAPKDARVGVDFAGVVQSVGAKVTHYKVGDRVFGARGGAFAQYITAREDSSLAHMPDSLDFEQAAAMPIAALTALQGLRDHGRLHAGQQVLINGASGGVGTFAIQIAKALGAEVTGVCSTRNVELVKSAGADHVIDYTQADFTARAERYDMILDNVGNHALMDVRRALKPNGIVVIVSGPKTEPFLGPVWRMLGAAVIRPFVDDRFVSFVAHTNRDDLEYLSALAAQGKLTPVIDKRYSLDQVSEAVDYQGTGHARGKVILRVD